jgi:hypothetical protein
MATGIICENVTGPGPTRCIRFGPVRPGCDPRCEQYQQPTGYVEASEWAEYMLQNHDQRQCPGCGKWTIWEPRSQERTEP